MDFVNDTNVEAGWTLGFERDGRELLVVAVKATFDIPEKNDEETLLSQHQVPLTESDKFTGEPGFSATLYESDYAHRKPACDVVLNGSAYAPGGRPTQKVTVGLHVGPVRKRFDVVGERRWAAVLLAAASTRPQPFTRLSISYDCAYGGMDTSESNPDRVETFLDNPVGVGFYPLTKSKTMIAKLLPNAQEIGRPIKTYRGKHRPMAFGAIGRNFKCRVPFAGTYDQSWLDERAPFFPDDFDYRYFQCAPADQQMPYPKGGEEVVLENLTPERIKRFRLPKMPMPVLFVPHRGKASQQNAVIDTLVIEPDEGRFTLTWRVSLPLRKNCFEIARTVVGKTLRVHRREVRTAGKTFYANLAELISAKRNGEPSSS